MRQAVIQTAIQKAILKTDVLCSIACVKLLAGSVVDVEDTTLGSFRDGKRRWTVHGPCKLAVRVCEEDLSFESTERGSERWVLVKQGA